MIKVKLLYDLRKHGYFAYAVEGYPFGGMSHQPLLDACRGLHNLGVSDDQYVGLYRGDRLQMTCTIGYGRRVTIREKSTGLRPVPWKPYSGFVR